MGKKLKLKKRNVWKQDSRTLTGFHDTKTQNAAESKSADPTSTDLQPEMKPSFPVSLPFRPAIPNSGVTAPLVPTDNPPISKDNPPAPNDHSPVLVINVPLPDVGLSDSKLAGFDIARVASKEVSVGDPKDSDAAEVDHNVIPLTKVAIPSERRASAAEECINFDIRSCLPHNHPSVLGAQRIEQDNLLENPTQGQQNDYDIEQHMIQLTINRKTGERSTTLLLNYDISTPSNIITSNDTLSTTKRVGFVTPQTSCFSNRTLCENLPLCEAPNSSSSNQDRDTGAPATIGSGNGPQGISAESTDAATTHNCWDWRVVYGNSNYCKDLSWFTEFRALYKICGKFQILGVGTVDLELSRGPYNLKTSKVTLKDVLFIPSAYCNGARWADLMEAVGAKSHELSPFRALGKKGEVLVWSHLDEAEWSKLRLPGMNHESEVVDTTRKQSGHAAWNLDMNIYWDAFSESALPDEE